LEISNLNQISKLRQWRILVNILLKQYLGLGGGQLFEQQLVKLRASQKEMPKQKAKNPILTRLSLT
jgi:hypothetical protein